ncbi:MAG: response regulator transcription factor [Spirochaetales bacterium]|nr:response regulator transcription factor [Spirochaetales bacterium]
MDKPEKKEKLLVVEDEVDIRELISFNLEMCGYEVIRASDGMEGWEKARSENPDLIVLDLMLPGIDGFEVCKRLRGEKSTQNIPIIMLTARSEEENMVKGLELGADDYVTKPFSPRVLVARVKAVLRRKGVLKETTSHRVVSLHGISIDPARHEVRAGGKSITLSATEFSILYFLAENPGWVFSRSQIIDAVKGEDYPVTSRSVDVQILGIRKKLGGKGDCIETVRGVGYRMESVE